MEERLRMEVRRLDGMLVVKHLKRNYIFELIDIRAIQTPRTDYSAQSSAGIHPERMQNLNLNQAPISTPAAYPTTKPVATTSPSKPQKLSNQIFVEDIFVIITSGQHSGNSGIIIQHTSTQCTLVLDGPERKRVTIEKVDLSVMKPEKKSKVKVLEGEFAGMSGLVIGIDGLDGIVKLNGTSDFKIIVMAHLAKTI